ncbi:MAG: DegT/DnrJ/EryC1/StrS family aminotransferase [Pirellulales bacterium]|nr:DegT/DnrJ/EryC1/StrS family aminotransferase [Pirellulales bacterium]
MFHHDDDAGVPLIDVARENDPIQHELDTAWSRVRESGRFVFGPEVELLEERIAEHCRVSHGIGCASGSDALLLALMALDIGPGDEVILPSFTFFATASAVWRLGGMPVFVDIEPVHFQMDLEKLEAAITRSTKAIMPVHLFGQCGEMGEIMKIAHRHGLAVVEDAAQAIGAEYNGHRAGGIGDIGCFSFYPTKNLGAFGDGGMLTTNDDKIGQRLRLLRGHGMAPRYYHREVGINSRLDALQAAVLNVKWNHLSGWTDARRSNAGRYDHLFREADLTDWISLPSQDSRCRHVWNQYVIRVPDGRRDDLRAYLAERNIGTEIYYPVPVHRQDCFAALDYPAGQMPETERAAGEVLAIPIFPGLTVEEQSRVVGACRSFYTNQRAAVAA